MTIAFIILMVMRSWGGTETNYHAPDIRTGGGSGRGRSSCSSSSGRGSFAVQPNAASRLAYAVRAHIEVVHARKHVAPARFRVGFLVPAAHVFAGRTVATSEVSECSIRGVTIV